MKLKEHIEKRGLNFSTYAPLIGVTPQAVSRYASGDRIPEKDVMQAILEDSGGEVTPNDFYTQ